METTADFLEIWINDAALDRQRVALIEGMQKDESFWQDLFANYTQGKIELAFPLDYKGQMGKSALSFLVLVLLFRK
jgi:hypothetical protein